MRKTVHSTSKRIGWVVVCAPDSDIRIVRFDESQVAPYSLCSMKGKRTGTIFPSEAQAQKAAKAVFEHDSTIGFITVLPVGMLEVSRVRK